MLPAFPLTRGNQMSYEFSDDEKAMINKIFRRLILTHDTGDQMAAAEYLSAIRPLVKILAKGDLHKPVIEVNPSGFLYEENARLRAMLKIYRKYCTKLLRMRFPGAPPFELALRVYDPEVPVTKDYQDFNAMEGHLTAVQMKVDKWDREKMGLPEEEPIYKVHNPQTGRVFFSYLTLAECPYYAKLHKMLEDKFESDMKSDYRSQDLKAYERAMRAIQGLAPEAYEQAKENVRKEFGLPEGYKHTA